MKKRDLILRIVFMSFFLVISTVVFYLPKHEEFASALSFLTTIDKLSLVEVTDGIVLEKTYPVKDEVGMTLKDTVFKVVNGNNYDVTYKISIESMKDDPSVSYMNLNNLKYSYKVNNGEYSEIKNVTENGILDLGTLEKNSENTYSIKFWIDYNSSNDIYGSTFSAAISLAKSE